MTGNVIRMADFIPNGEAAVGAVAIEWFGKTKHVSVVKEVRQDGVLVSETNYNRCQYSERFIHFDSPRLSGFYHN